MKPEAKGLVSTTVAGDKNVVPSMVVRQQRFQQLGISAIPAHKRDQSAASSSSAAHPSEESISSLMSAANELSGSIQQQQQQAQLFDQDGLVVPKRVLHHPASAAQPIIRDLNRELKFNQVRGKNVLEQKSELKKAMERLEESRRKKEAEQERLGRRTSLELRLEERAQRIAKESGSQSAASSAPGVPEKGTSTACNSIGGFSLRPSVAR